MAQEVHTKETEERQAVVGQERPPVEELPAPVAGERASRQEATPATVPSAAPPIPPRHPLTARRRQMPPGGRWALGIGLVVLGAFSWYVLGFGVAYAPNMFYAMLVAALPAVTCLVAGWLLRSWWGLVAAAVVYVAVGVPIWVLFVSNFPLPVEFVWYVVLPAVVMSAIGTAIGMYRAR